VAGVIAVLFGVIVILRPVLDCGGCDRSILEFVIVWLFLVTVDDIGVDTPVTFTLNHLIKLLVVLITLAESELILLACKHDNLPVSLFCPSFMAPNLVERV
jgi:hypothetical protein